MVCVSLSVRSFIKFINWLHGQLSNRRRGRNDIFSPKTIFMPSSNIYLTTKWAIISSTNSLFLIEKEYTAPGTWSDISLVRQGLKNGKTYIMSVQNPFLMWLYPENGNSYLLYECRFWKPVPETIRVPNFRSVSQLIRKLWVPRNAPEYELCVAYPEKAWGYLF